MSFASRCKNMKDVCIVASARAPVGKFGGIFKDTPVVQLGKQTIVQLLQNYKIKPSWIKSSYTGVYMQKNLGPSPMKQISNQIDGLNHMNCTYINKLCASAMKAIMMGYMQIKADLTDMILVGGMDNMSQQFFFLPRKQQGDQVTTIFNCKIQNKMLVNIGDEYAKREGYSRQQQDNYTENSYKRAIAACGKLDSVVPIKVGDQLHTVDQIFNPMDKLRKMKALYKGGSVTFFNVGPFGDGASFMVLTTRERAEELNLPIIASIVGMAEQELPSTQWMESHLPPIESLVQKHKLKMEEIDYFQICESLAIIPLVSMRRHGIPIEKMNLFGGDLVYGHIIGSTGARIMQHLMLGLQKDGIGLAAMPSACGGGTAVLLRKE